MCDYSLQNVLSRPAKIGDKLTTHQFPAGTRGFCAPENSAMAVCVLPGTELGFSSEVTVPGMFSWKSRTVHCRTAIFRQVNRDLLHTHHDAIEFPDGHVALLTHLDVGQEATVLQLPAQPTTEAEAEKQRCAEYVAELSET
jgi:hypothetical protein